MAARIGTAAWAIPKASAGAFPAEGGGVLERYARVFDCVEINSSFYRPHRPATYARWAASVPDAFRFAVKVPKAITHEARLRDCDDRIAAFTGEVSALGAKLGPLLLQLPPSLPFDPILVEAACGRLARAARVVCEPRHPTWFTPQVDRWLADRLIARVAADPPQGPHGDRPGGWRGLAYHRLHGAPKTYYSAYAAEDLASLAQRLSQRDAEETWCVFDNTALGAATANALELKDRLTGAEAGDGEQVALRRGVPR